MNSVAMTIINPRKEHWPSRGSNQRTPVLTSATLPTELWGSALQKEEHRTNMHYILLEARQNIPTIKANSRNYDISIAQ